MQKTAGGMGIRQISWNSTFQIHVQVLEFLAVDKKRKAPQYWWCKPPVACEDRFMRDGTIQLGGGLSV